METRIQVPVKNDAESYKICKEHLTMKFEDIKPFVRHVEQISPANPRFAPQILKSYDNCIIYLREGNLRIRIGKDTFSLSRGSVIFWRCGIEYTIEQTSDDAHYIMIHFDFTNSKQLSSGFRILPEAPEIFTDYRITDTSIIDDEKNFNSVVFVESLTPLEEMFVGICSEFHNPQKHLDMRVMARMILILSEMEASNYKAQRNQLPTKTEEILDFIHSHYTENLSNKSISAMFGFHPQHLNKLIRAKTGYSIHKYIIMRRISKACELLSTTKIPVAEVGYSVGFQNSNHFSRYFKEFMMMSPGTYRKKNSIL